MSFYTVSEDACAICTEICVVIDVVTSNCLCKRIIHINAVVRLLQCQNLCFICVPVCSFTVFFPESFKCCRQMFQGLAQSRHLCYTVAGETERIFQRLVFLYCCKLLLFFSAVAHRNTAVGLKSIGLLLRSAATDTGDYASCGFTSLGKY